MGVLSYADCLERSYQVNWKISEVLGFADFDLERPWLPGTLSGGTGLACLDPYEKRLLTHVEMGAYAHLFGYVEAFIAPQMVALAQEAQAAENPAFEALTNFASEEVKHIHLFREVRKRVNEKIGFPLRLLGGELEVAGEVLAKAPGAVLLLTSAIEWLTQYHYLAAMKGSTELDPLTKEIFRAHWMEEAQHAHLDRLELLRVFGILPEEGRDQAIADLVQLLAALDRLLQEQAALDLANLVTYLDRDFGPEDRAAILASLLRAKRYCFIKCGVTHPNFQEVFLQVTTPAQRERVQESLGWLSP